MNKFILPLQKSIIKPVILKALFTVLTAFGICMLYAQPCVTEICNGIDDDCDGFIDEHEGLNFDGSDDYINVGSWWNYQEFTIQMWLNPGASQNTYADIIDNNHNGTDRWVCQQLENSTNEYTWGVNLIGGNAVINFNLIANVWQHLTLVKGVSETQVFIDGELIGSAPCSGTISEGGIGLDNIFIGNFNGGGRNWNGTMDEIRLWDFALTQSEIQSDMYCGLSGNESGLFVYYKLNQGIAGANNTSITTAIDGSGNSHHGTLEGFDLVGSNSNFILGVDLFECGERYLDSDGDGYGDPESSMITSCNAPGYVSNNDDCNDADSSVNPAATEICNEIDDDCDGMIDGDDPNVSGLLIWFLDADNDDYGNPDQYVLTCNQPSGYAGTGTDCDDSNSSVYPDATEIADGLDNDCDGLVDEALNVMNIEAGDCEVVFYGYAPEACKTLTVTVSGGISPYTYSWGNGSTSSSTVVCPEETSIYSVTVTDANGQSAEDNVTVQVINVSCGNNNNKVLVCHIPPGQPENAQVICITPSAIPDHLAHGCYVGICDAPDPCETGSQSMATPQSDAVSEISGHLLENPVMIQSYDEVLFLINPNPADDRIEVQSSLFPGHISVMDLSGKVILHQDAIGYKNSINTALLSDGIYLIRLENGTTSFIKSFVIIH